MIQISWYGRCSQQRQQLDLNTTIKASNTPHLFPAIDIRGGQAVRLLQGDYDRETNFEMTPVEAGLRWERDGARWLHVVDLDGALTGSSANLEHIERLVKTVRIPVQMGGGIRTEQAARAAFEAGVRRIVLGTKAAQDPDFVGEMVSRYGERIVVSVDARGGKVAVDGWTGVTATRADEALRQMQRLGVKTAIYTPIEVDGMQQGPQLEELKAAARASSLQLIYASGVGTLKHLRDIAALQLPNLAGVIVGTALYKKNFKVHEGENALVEGTRTLTAA